MIPRDIQEQFKKQYNPEGSILRRAQYRMLEMLSFIDDVCVKNNIKYWIDSGTLLGARRHGGFIPWDDDVDICMPREDYVKFKDIMLHNNPSDEFVLQCHQTDNHYFATWDTLRDLKTEMSGNGKRLENFKFRGLQIDIFLIDDRCNKPMWKFFRYYFAYLINAPLFEGRFTKYIRWNVPFSFFLLTKILLPASRFLTKSSKQFLFYGNGMFWYLKWSRQVIYPLSRIEFEGKKFFAPNNVDKYLEVMYGEWRTIPSERYRQTHNFSFRFLNENI
jgi:hypothetical protein